MPTVLGLRLLLVGLPLAASVVLPHCGLRCRVGTQRCGVRCCTDDDKQPESETGTSFSELLDRAVIDPERPSSEDEPALLTAFKKLVDEDYQMAEALYAGGVFAILIFFSQQAVRVYKHCYFQPDKLCPWDPMTGVDQFWF